MVFTKKLFKYVNRSLNPKVLAIAVKDQAFQQFWNSKTMAKMVAEQFDIAFIKYICLYVILSFLAKIHFFISCFFSGTDCFVCVCICVGGTFFELDFFVNSTRS